MMQLKFIVINSYFISEIYLESYDNIFGVNNHASGTIVVAQIRSNEILETNDNIDISGTKLRGGIIITNNPKQRDAFLKVSVNYDDDDESDYDII